MQNAFRHNNHTGRWLTPFRPQWHPSREDIFVVGSMVRPRQVGFTSSSSVYEICGAGKLPGHSEVGQHGKIANFLGKSNVGLARVCCMPLGVVIDKLPKGIPWLSPGYIYIHSSQGFLSPVNSLIVSATSTSDLLCSTFPPQIELFSTTGELVHAFRGEHLQSVCSLNVFHPTRNLVAGGNSSGRVHIFK